MSFIRLSEIKQKTFKDPIDAFQVNDIYRELTRILRILPIIVGNEEPEGSVDADVGAMFVYKVGNVGKLFVKTSGIKTTTGWTEIT